MFGFRIVGGVVAAALIVLSIHRYRRRNISRLNLILTCFFSLIVLGLSLQPNLFNPLFESFNFQPGNQRRLIGALIAATVVLFVLQVRTMSQSDTNSQAIRQLVEALAVQSFDWEAARSLPPGQRLVVLLPAFNEAENVGAVVHSMPDEVEGLPVVTVVVDDGSQDATVEVARRAGALVARHPIRRGGGLALRVGYEIALRLDAKVVVSMDADGQHVPSEMPLLVKPILEDQADMVNGSRVLGEFQRESAVRHAGVHVFSWFVTVMTGSRVTDVSSGYRATRAEVLRTLVLKQDQFWTSELLIEGMRQRLRIKEVPVTILARAGGHSKKPKNAKYAWNFTKAIMKTWLR